MTDGWFDADPRLLPTSRLLTAAGVALQRSYRRAAAAHGLTHTALGVLGVLAVTEAVSHRELAARLDIAPATLTPAVDALEGAGELVRHRDRADRRVVRLSITARGRERLAAAEAGMQVFGARLPQPPAAQEAAMRAYLLTVLAALAAEQEEACS